MTRRLLTVLFVLTLVAGYVDAVAFFGLGVFTANMTGNTVLLGGGIVSLFGTALPGSIGIWPPLLSLGCFVGGAVIAALVLRGRTGKPPRGSKALVAGVAALIAVAAALRHLAPHAGGFPPLAVALLSVVMGVQSVVATRSGIAGVSTTFVTGTLVRIVLDVAGVRRDEPFVRAEGGANAGVWACYLAGAVGGAFALHALQADALWLPAGVVALLLPVL